MKWPARSSISFASMRSMQGRPGARVGAREQHLRDAFGRKVLIVGRPAAPQPRAVGTQTAARTSSPGSPVGTTTTIRPVSPSRSKDLSWFYTEAGQREWVSGDWWGGGDAAPRAIRGGHSPAAASRHVQLARPGTSPIGHDTLHGVGMSLMRLKGGT